MALIDGLDVGEAGYVSARPCEARGELLADRIGGGNEHDRHRAGLDEEGSNRRRASGEDDVGPQAHELSRRRRRGLDLAAAETDVDPQVLALAPAEPLHLIAKGGELDQPLGIVGSRQHAKPSKPPRLLRGCATVEGRRGRKTQNDLSSPHPSTRIYERLRVR